MTRPSRCARVFAVLTRMRKTHVFSDERPSNRSSAPSTRSQVSCTTSSASARVGTKICATCSSDECHSRTIRRNVSSSPARRAATRSASVGSTRRTYRKAHRGDDEWAVTGSNRRPPGCKPGALPAELTAPAIVDRGLDYRSRRREAPSALPEAPSALPIVSRRLAARGERSLQRGPGHYRKVPSSSDTWIRDSRKSWRHSARRFQGGRGGLSGHARVSRRREWRRTHLGGSPLSAPQQREGRVLASRTPWWAAEVPRCAVRAVEAELRRIHVLRILDPVGEPAAPVEAARPDRRPRRSPRQSTAGRSRSPGGRIQPHAQSAPRSGGRLWPFG